MEKSKSEIDLLEFLIKIYLYLKKYWWILLIAVLTGIIYTFIFSNSKTVSYGSSMIISVKPDNDYMYAITFKEFSKRYEKNPAEVIIGIINQANEFIKSGNTEKLAQKMNLNATDLKGIKSIIPEYKFEKGVSPGNIVQIKVVSGNKEVYNKLGEGIEFLINDNPYVKEKISEDSLMLINMIDKIEIKTKELDSFAEKFLKSGKTTEFFVFKDDSFFGESVMLSSLKEKLNNELHNLKQAKIVEDFYSPKSKTASIKVPVIINTVIFLFLGIVIIFFIVFNKKAKSFEDKNKKSE